jgi:hypothetical protein
MSFLSVSLAVVLELSGFNGSELSVFSKFDNNNVKLGDPVKYEITFRGNGDFTSLRTPQIAKAVGNREWKVDMFSVKTTTFKNAKVFEYMMLPLKEGLVYFPQVEFSFGKDGQIIKTQEIPVSVRAGEKVFLAGTDEDYEDEMMPDGIVVTPPEDLSEDDMFIWQKACRTLDPELFAKFDFPVARLNAASCHLIKNQWAKAMGIYKALEWRIGQTKEIEHGIMCCISRKTGQKSAQLPAWREAFRFVLKYDWKLRISVVLGCVISVFLSFFVLHRLIKILAVLAIVFIVPQDAYSFSSLFESLRSRHNSFFSGFGTQMHSNEVAEIKAEISLPEKSLMVGEPFAFEIGLEVPEKSALHSIRLDFDKTYALTFTGGNETLSDGKSDKKGYLRKRFKVYARYDAPIETAIQATISGMIRVVRRYNSGGMNSVMTSENSFTVNSNKLRVKVLPLDEASRPKDFLGVVGCDASITSTIRENVFRTNDVVVVENSFTIDGFVPEGAFEGVFERNERTVSFRSYFIADGRDEIPSKEVAYYDTKTRSYKFVMSAPIKINYRSDDQNSSSIKDRAVDAELEKTGKIADLRFAPFRDAPIVGKAVLGDGAKSTDKFGTWLRVTEGGITGWVDVSSQRNH